MIIYLSAYTLSMNSKSDTYYLNILPFLITVEFFVFKRALVVLLVIIIAHLVATVIIGWSHGIDILGWLIRDFSPRTYILFAIGLTYFVQRQMRTMPENDLTRDGQRIITDFQKIIRGLPAHRQKDAAELERSLQGYVNSIDSYRRLRARDSSVDINRLAHGLLQVLRQEEMNPSVDEQAYRQKIGFMMQQVGQMASCTGGTLHLEDISEGKTGLKLYDAFGCANKYKREQTAFIGVYHKNDIVVRAFQSRRPASWTMTDHSTQIPLIDTALAKKSEIRSIYSIPLTIGSTRGVATFYRNIPKSFHGQDAALLENAMDYIVATIEHHFFRINSARQSQDYMNNINLLRLTAIEMTRLTSVQEILQYTVRLTKEEFGAQTSSPSRLS